MKPKKKKVLKFGIIGLAVLLAAAGVLYFTVFSKSRTASGNEQPRTARVIKGTLSSSIEGSGPVASSTRKEISPKTTSTVEKIYFKEGDAVKAGDLMFELDDTDALLDIENTKNNIEQTQLTLDDNLESIAELTVKAPFDGQVTELNVKAGDSVNGTILKITDTSRLKLRVPFNAGGISGITPGKKVLVNLQELMQSVEGTVTYVSKKPYNTAAGGQLYNVEIEIDNPGSITEGMTANAEAEVGGTAVTSVQSGTLTYINSKGIRSSSGSIVKSVNVIDNEYVSAGDLLVELENDNLQFNLNSTRLKLKNLQQQLEIQQEQLSNYKLTAPCNGTITTQNVTLGDTVSAGKVLAAVADMDSLEFEVTIDELDISSIEVGQDVKITADALPETTDSPLSGKVTKISMEGTSSNGVTTYPVTISIDKNEKLKAGMNVNGEIITSLKNDTLMVPLEAVTKVGGSSFVYVVGDGNQDARQGNSEGGSRIPGANGNFRAGNAGAGNSGTGGDGQTGGSPASGSPATGGQTGAWQGRNGQTGGSSSNGGAFTARRAGNSSSYYANATMVRVETGISNNTYIEITSGLTEGQIVMLPAVSASSGSSISTETQRFNRQGSFGGGMMMGAAPSGGR
jgi:HlyD family secretion protein